MLTDDFESGLNNMRIGVVQGSLPVSLVENKNFSFLYNLFSLVSVSLGMHVP